jgi:integrase
VTRSRRLPKVLTSDEQRAFLAQFNKRYISALRNLVIVRLMLECGLRCGELVAVRPEHLDLDTCRLIVREGKGKKDRTLWFSDDLRDLIARWTQRRPDLRVAPVLAPWRAAQHPVPAGTRQEKGRGCRYPGGQPNNAAHAQAHLRHGPFQARAKHLAGPTGARALFSYHHADLHAPHRL